MNTHRRESIMSVNPGWRITECLNVYNVSRAHIFSPRWAGNDGSGPREGAKNNYMKRRVEQLISIPIYITFFLCIPVFIHWDMTKSSWYVKRLKRATYAEIKEKMLSVEWRYDWQYPTSLFDKKDFNENYFHASIFRFGDVGYLLTPYGYWMASLLQRKIRKSLPEYIIRHKSYVN